MFQRVLVPLDGSPLAETVLPYVTEIASRFKAEVLLLRVVPLVGQVAAMSHVQETPGAVPAEVAALNQMMADEVKESERYLNAATAKLQAGELTVTWEVRRGPAADEIIACAKERKVDLIAISTHGRSGLGRLVFGSVADQVTRDSRLPMLLIRP